MLKKIVVLFTGYGCTTALMLSCSVPTNSCIDPTKVNKDAICTMQYDPVCGCDKQTYANACLADNAGVTSYTKGACK